MTLSPQKILETINLAQIEVVPIHDLMPYARNARVHSEYQISVIASSIKEFGFLNPVLIDEAGTIRAGHGRVLAAMKLGLEVVPCRRLAHLSDEEWQAYVLIDNRSAELATWDMDMLKLELEDITTRIDDVDLKSIGVESWIRDLGLGLGVDAEPKPTKQQNGTGEDVPEYIPQRCKPGEAYRLGEHVLVCGSCLDERVLLNGTLRLGKAVDFVFTDPPYGVDFAYNNHKDKGGAEYRAFIRDVWAMLKAMKPPAGIVVTPGNANLPLWLGMDDFKLACWVRKNAMSPSSIAHLNLFEILLLYGVKAKRTNDLLEYGVNNKQEGVGDHPCPKLLTLVVDVLDSWAPPGAVLFEPFAGSGTTIIAAEKTGRVCLAIEKDPHYCDIILARYEQFTGNSAEQC